mgnify:CR=1 FL=1
MNRLKELREAKGLTQTDVALRLGTTQPTVDRHERGDRGLSGFAIEGYARLYGVAPAELFTRKPVPAESSEEVEYQY